MAMIPPHIIDEIMQTARIEEVIGEFVQLKRAGSNLKGLSPFTDEKTPSFVVSPAKQIFKCFSTGKGGTVVSFLMEKEHYSYPEALKWLADKYGIPLPEDKPQTQEELDAISERESLYIINEFAKNHFMRNMHETDEGKKIGLSYFIERGFRPEIIEKFQLGYCINKGDDFTKAALEKGFKLEYLERVGLVKSKDDRHFDFFRGRVMFPIHSVSGRILGFGGRTLITDKKIAKYFNSPESIIYNKSEILYGLHFAKGDIIKYDQCFLCEGYTDVISMFQAGIQNVVASSGTSLTKEQIRLVKRYTSNITILYDGDAAGIKASFRGIDLILEEGMNVKVVLFPEGEDPDSYSKAVSSTELETYIEEHTQDFISFKADILLAEHQDDPIRRAELIKEIVHSVALIPETITRSVYIQSIAQRFNIDENVLTAELLKLRKDHVANQYDAPEINQIPTPRQEPVQQSISVPVENEEPFDHNEYDLARILALYGPLMITIDQVNENGANEKVETSVAEFICMEMDVDELTFEYAVFNRLHNIISEGLSENSLTELSYLKKLNDPELVSFVTEIELDRHELSPNWISRHNIFTSSEKDKIQQAVISSMYTFKVSKVEKQIKSIHSELVERENELEEEDLIILISKQAALEQVRKAIFEKLGRIVPR